MTRRRGTTLLHNRATQGEDEMAIPGLMLRGKCWGLRVRVPDRLREIIGRKEIWKSFGPVSYADARRLAMIERLAIEQRFGSAERELGAPRRVPLNQETAFHFARAVLDQLIRHAPPIPVDARLRAEELESVQEEAYNVGHSVGDAGLQRIAISLARSMGMRVSPRDPDFLLVCDSVQQALIEDLARRQDMLSGRMPRTYDSLFSGVGGPESTSPLTVSQAIVAFKADPERARAAPKTRSAWEFRLRTIEELLGANRPVASITRVDIRQCSNKLVQITIRTCRACLALRRKP